MQATVGKILTPFAVLLALLFVVGTFFMPSLEMFFATFAVILFTIGFWILSKFFQNLADSIPEQQQWEERND